MQQQTLSEPLRAASVSNMTEQELLSLGRGGDKAAIGELFSRHYQHSLRVAKRILSSAEDSEDAVQDAYCSVLQHIDSFRGDASFGTWLTRIVVNSCRMSFRQPSRRFLFISDDAVEAFANRRREPLERSPESCASQSEVAATLHSAIAGLPPDLHDPYTLFSYSEMSVAEVAATLGLTLAAAKTRIFRARGALRIALNRAWRIARPTTPAPGDHRLVEETENAGWQSGARAAVHARHSNTQSKSGRRRLEYARPAQSRPRIYR